MQGFNMGRYVPPEYEGTTSANKLAGKNALGNRARKSGQGILTVRFEVPFAIWCTTCPKPTIIGQGVRFNAEKKKVGNYYSTPIYSFRMKHNVCGGWMEIRTDPKNTAYVVTEGAKKRDTGEDKHVDGEIRIRTDQERERLENDAFAAFEGKVEDKKQVANDKSRIEQLHRSQGKDWDDPYASSMKLRRAFRADRKLREQNEALTEDLKGRMSLGLDLLGETEEDRRRAGVVDFGDFNVENAIDRAKSKPLFGDKPAPIATSAKKIKKITPASQARHTKEKLRLELEKNTRAALDPFLTADKSITPAAAILPLIRRKTSLNEVPASAYPPLSVEKHSTSLALVDYDSD